MSKSKSAKSFCERDTGVKAPATIGGQLKILESRRLLIHDIVSARRVLETVNYYRLVHYFAVFLDETGESYVEGTKFEDGVRLYNFDKKLRSVILIALEEVEIAARAAISNYHSAKYGATGYLKEDAFDRRHNHRGFMNRVERTIAKNADLSFVRHHNRKYGGTFPLWVLMEMFSFGVLAVFYQDLKTLDKKEIAEYYFGHDSRNVENWLENLAILRNRCAHYNRIYGNPLPGDIRGGESEESSSLFEHMLAVKALHRGEQFFVNEMRVLFDEYSDVVEPAVLGFPENWALYFTVPC
jgi:abortive infection bacteriophage resistance protein